MWPDNETERDFLNFTGVADTVSEIIVQASDRPVSIGVSGAWGVGKSSMIKLIRRALEKRQCDKKAEFVFVEFNAWLYQGYDDARASLLEVIAETLEREANKRQIGLEKAKELLKRVDWLRAAKLTVGPALALALGVPPIGLVGEALRLVKAVKAGEADSEDISAIEETIGGMGNAFTGLLKQRPDSSPPKEIHAIRQCFQEALCEMGVKLVVLIDDLDRCLPPTTISTLEAIRLFLFLDNTAFVIAADDAMIKHAVRKHFEGIKDEDLVTNYFDKLVQIPIRVPPLGIQEVRAYMMLLFVDDSSLPESEREAIREKVCAQLQQTWRGKRVDRAFMQTLHDSLPDDLVARFDTSDRLAPLMASASQIAGNPRLIKRFLNALSIRMTIAHAHSVGIDEAVLAKLMLFERCGDQKAYGELIKAVNEDEEGKPRFLADWEAKASTGDRPPLDGSWDTDFFREWLNVYPPIAGLDLRGALYVSREHAPLAAPEDRLSSEGAKLLSAILENPDMANELHDQMILLPRPEVTIIMDRVLERARQQQEWGTQPILDAMLAVAAADPLQGVRVATFLRERPPAQITASIVPKIGDQPWASEVFTAWHESDVDATVKRAITQSTKAAQRR